MLARALRTASRVQAPTAPGDILEGCDIAIKSSLSQCWDEICDDQKSIIAILAVAYIYQVVDPMITPTGAPVVNPIKNHFCSIISAIWSVLNFCVCYFAG